MRYSSGVRFSRAKPTGSYRVLQSSTRRVASHSDSLRDARVDADYWIKAGAKSMEIQERFPSGKWVTVDTVTRESESHATKTTAPTQRGHATVHMPAVGDRVRISAVRNPEVGGRSAYVGRIGTVERVIKGRRAARLRLDDGSVWEASFDNISPV